MPKPRIERDWIEWLKIVVLFGAAIGAFGTLTAFARGAFDIPSKSNLERKYVTKEHANVVHDGMDKKLDQIIEFQNDLNIYLMRNRRWRAR